MQIQPKLNLLPFQKENANTAVWQLATAELILKFRDALVDHQISERESRGRLGLAFCTFAAERKPMGLACGTLGGRLFPGRMQPSTCVSSGTPILPKIFIERLVSDEGVQTLMAVPPKAFQFPSKDLLAKRQNPLRPAPLHEAGHIAVILVCLRCQAGFEGLLLSQLSWSVSLLETAYPWARMACLVDWRTATSTHSSLQSGLLRRICALDSRIQTANIKIKPTSHISAQTPVGTEAPSKCQAPES